MRYDMWGMAEYVGEPVWKTGGCGAWTEWKMWVSYWCGTPHLARRLCLVRLAVSAAALAWSRCFANCGAEGCERFSGSGWR